jgi:hypothetical protein
VSNNNIEIDEPMNPFDPEALRADPSDGDIPTRRIVHHMKVRKPSRSEFFRVHPDPAYTTDVYIIEAGESIGLFDAVWLEDWTQYSQQHPVRVRP